MTQTDRRARFMAAYSPDKTTPQIARDADVTEAYVRCACSKLKLPPPRRQAVRPGASDMRQRMGWPKGLAFTDARGIK